MSKETTTRLQSLSMGINWGAIKTNIITAFVFGTLGLIGGYFASINLHSDARASVVQDMQIVSKAQSR